MFNELSDSMYLFSEVIVNFIVGITILKEKNKKENFNKAKFYKERP